MAMTLAQHRAQLQQWIDEAIEGREKPENAARRLRAYIKEFGLPLAVAVFDDGIIVLVDHP